MIYIDPSELREGPEKSSKALPLLSIFKDKIRPVKDLEKNTGADLMISPSNLPHPVSPFLLNRHIEGGATLVQLKYGHDLVSSIVDDRVKESQAKMILTGAMPWQCCLLAIGAFESWGPERELFINFEPTYNKAGFPFSHYLAAKAMWIKRGGFFDTVLEKDLEEWIRVEQSAIDKVRTNPQRIIYPKSPVLYEEETNFDNDDFSKKEWIAAQSLTLITDWRNLLNDLPGIADKKIRAIVRYMEDNDVERNWYSFMELLENGRLIEITGIGTGLESKIKNYLENK